MNKQEVVDYFNTIALVRDYWKKRNWYYHKTVENLCRFIVPEHSRVLEIGSGTGDLLNAVKPAYGVGVDISRAMVTTAKKKYPQLTWIVADAENFESDGIFDYVIFSDLVGYLADIESSFHTLKAISRGHTRIIITYYNYLWEPILQLAELLNLKAKGPVQNWMSPSDVENMLWLAGFEVVKKGNKLILPLGIPLVSAFFNKIIANLPIFSRLGLIHYVIARPQSQKERDYSVSIIIPARNEKGNIENAILRLPRFGSSQEIIFIEGHSEDGTLDEIRRVVDKYDSKPDIRYAVQKGIGKGDAVRLGFEMATGEVLMILDADLTVAPEDLPKFYRAIVSGRGEFINGSRLVYQLEKESMRFLNILGNKFFSLMFSWLLGQRIKDTLCGTKVLFRDDYQKIAVGRKYFGEFDPFGDFDLLFGAAKLNLKIVELPIRYQTRTYGETNIQRWRHGWLLLKMTLFAIRKLKFI
ncbi:MAG: glycosyltransferase [Minisyncoccia bacterium]